MPVAIASAPPLALLVAITAVGPLALNIFMPSMPALPAEFDTDYGTVQLTLSLYLIGTALSQLIYGPLSDRYGRRPVLLVGLSLFLVGSLIGYLAQSIEALILGRIVQAVGGCAGLVLGRAIVRDVFDRDKSASVIAYVTSAMVIAPMIGPAIGGFLDAQAGWRSSFLLLIGIGGIVLAFALLILRETNTQRCADLGLISLVSSYPSLLGRPMFGLYAAQTAFGSAAFFSFLGGGPYVVVELLGRTSQDYGLWFAMASIGYMSGNFFAGRYSERFGINRMLMIGAAATLLGGLALVLVMLTHTLALPTLFGCMLIMAFGNGITIPNGLAGAVSADPSRAGAASGLAGFGQMGVGAGASTITGAWLVQSSTAWPLIAMMAGSAALAVLMALTIWAASAKERALDRGTALSRSAAE